MPFGPPPRTALESLTECEARQIGQQLVLHTVAAANQARQRSMQTPDGDIDAFDELFANDQLFNGGRLCAFLWGPSLVVLYV